MRIFDAIFGRKPAHQTPAPAAKPASRAVASNAASQFQHSASSPNSVNSASSPHNMRKDLIRMVLRETLTRNGIPTHWIGADLLRATSKGKDSGIHVRLMLLHWDERLPIHAPAFEQNFYKRLVTMDPLAPNWLVGISWQFAMEDLSHCPALPHPGSWTSAPSAPVQSMHTPEPGVGVIEGPSMVGKQAHGTARDEMERLIAAGDAHRRPGEQNFEATQPITL